MKLPLYLGLYATFIVISSICGRMEACEWVEAISMRTATLKASGAGLHRHLSVDASIGSLKRFIDCQIAYRFVIPSGAYIDMDSVPPMRDHQIAPTLFDVEAPQEHSSDTPLYVCSKKSLRKNFVFNEHFEFPLHLRYHAPSETDAVVKLSPPRILVRCVDNSTFLNEKSCAQYIRKAPCDCQSPTKCEWVILSVKDAQPIEMSIPTGDPHMQPIVVIITAIFIVGGVVAIVVASLVAGDDKRKTD